MASKYIKSASGLFFASCIMALNSVPAHGQVYTDWSNLTYDAVNYKSVYSCLSATRRVALSSSEQMVDRDTLPVSPSGLLRVLPAESKEVATRCTEDVRFDTIPRKQHSAWIALLLQADRDSKAAELVSLMLSLEPDTTEFDYSEGSQSNANVDKDKKHQALVNRVAAQRYLEAVPSRLDAAWNHIGELDSLGDAERWTQRFDLARSLLQHALESGDSNYVRKAANKIVEIADGLRTERSQPLFQQRRGVVIAAKKMLNQDAEMDSLKKSTESYVALHKSVLAEFDLSDRYLGQAMKPLEGEFRFPAAIEAPVAEKVNVVLVDGMQSWPLNQVYPMLRRLKNKYPDIEVVHSIRTMGHFNGAPLEPQEEAETRRKFVQEFLDMPFSLVVENTSFWRLPDPDKRRVNEITPNAEEYGDRLWLVDKEGTIVYYGARNRSQEEDLDRMIGVLIEREAAD